MTKILGDQLKPDMLIRWRGPAIAGTCAGTTWRVKRGHLLRAVWRDSKRKDATWLLRAVDDPVWAKPVSVKMRDDEPREMSDRHIWLSEGDIRRGDLGPVSAETASEAVSAPAVGVCTCPIHDLMRMGNAGHQDGCPEKRSTT